MHEADRTAVARACAGDADAFRSLVESHSRYLFSVAQRLTGSAADAEDATLVMGRYLDDELARVGGLDKSISVMGKTGSAVLVDTSRCLHCGSRVKLGTYRLCLYIQYCSSREHGNLFDYHRHAADPVRFLATVNSRRSTKGDVSAPHQMS